MPQSFNLTLLCAQDGGSEPTFVDYENGITSAQWKTNAGCPVKTSDGGDNDGGGSEGGEKDAGDDASSGGSGIGWFFLLYVLIVLAACEADALVCLQITHLIHRLLRSGSILQLQ